MPTRSAICWRVGIFHGSLNGTRTELPGVFSVMAGCTACRRLVLFVTPCLLGKVVVDRLRLAFVKLVRG